jgi:4-carboxymuconolactone decarboxylase
LSDDDETKQGRLPWFLPEELDAAQRAFYDELISGPRGRDAVDEKGRVFGAMNARLLDPKLGAAIQNLNSVIRFDIDMPARSFEILLLELFRHGRNDVGWHHHLEPARKAGLTEEDLQAILTGVDSPGFTPEERLFRRVAQQILYESDLSDELFDELQEVFGLKTLFHMISIIGFWQNTGLSLRIWRLSLPEGLDPVFDQ